MGCNLREVYSRHTAATSASAESQSQFPSGVGGAEGGPSNKLGPRARGRQLAVERRRRRSWMRPSTWRYGRTSDRSTRRSPANPPRP